MSIGIVINFVMNNGILKKKFFPNKLPINFTWDSILF